MADSVASETLVVESHQGPYEVSFRRDVAACLRPPASPPGPEGPRPARQAAPGRLHYFIDEKVARLHARELREALESSSVLRLEARERAKSLEAMPRYVGHLLARGVRRGDALAAVGGGVVQDIVCFLAATLLRGLEWRFIPTTLLAQADSCIGSKSSINAGSAKNVLGTFTPPRSVAICLRFLDTLAEPDVRSGVGEMLKVHAIDGPDSFDRIASDYRRLFDSRETLAEYLRRSLEIKKRIVEADEFDRGPRNVMNYGHTFGHAIEAATRFAVPHGIAVTIGMDMANFIAARLGRMGEGHYARMHPVLAANYAGFERAPVPLEAFLSAVSKDKKNTSDKLGLILPDAEARPSRVYAANDEGFRLLCAEYLKRGRGGEALRGPAA